MPFWDLQPIRVEPMCGSLSSIPDKVAGEEGGADGDEDDGQVDLSAGVGRLGTGASQARRSNATESSERPLENLDVQTVTVTLLLQYLTAVYH